MIHGVAVKKLRVIPDERGFLMEILRDDDEIFEKFRQVYITTVYPGVVKGWHYHKLQRDNMTVIKGMAKIVLYDSRPESPTYGETNEFFDGRAEPRAHQHTPRCCTASRESEPRLLNVLTDFYLVSLNVKGITTSTFTGLSL